MAGVWQAIVFFQRKFVKKKPSVVKSTVSLFFSHPSQKKEIQMVYWLTPLLLSPLTGFELIISFICLRTRCKYFCVLFLSVIALLVGLLFFLSSTEQNIAIWNTFPPGNVILHHSALKPRAVIPGTLVVKVRAAALNPADYKVFNNLCLIPYLRYILPCSPSYNFAGIATEVNNCEGSTIKKGDFVYGVSFHGGMQEYLLAPCKLTGIIPKNVSFVQAAASPTVLFTALGGFKHFQKGGDGKKVLIIGASGGCGQAGVLLAKEMDVKEIHCIVSTKNIQNARNKGCTTVYDYTNPDSMKKLKEMNGYYDLIYDTVTSMEDTDYFPITSHTLSPKGGEYVAINGLVSDFLNKIYSDVFVGQNEKRKERFTLVMGDTISRERFDYLEKHPELFNSIDIAIVLDALNAENVKRAYEMLKSRRTVGKIVLTIGDQRKILSGE